MLRAFPGASPQLRMADRIDRSDNAAAETCGDHAERQRENERRANR
jgi:hypothetical protein